MRLPNPLPVQDPLGMDLKVQEAAGKVCPADTPGAGTDAARLWPRPVTHGPVLRSSGPPHTEALPWARMAPLALLPWRWQESSADAPGGQSTLLCSGQQQRATAHLTEGWSGEEQRRALSRRKAARGNWNSLSSG